MIEIAGGILIAIAVIIGLIFAAIIGIEFFILICIVLSIIFFGFDVVIKISLTYIGPVIFVISIIIYILKFWEWLSHGRTTNLKENDHVEIQIQDGGNWETKIISINNYYLITEAVKKLKILFPDKNLRIIDHEGKLVVRSGLWYWLSLKWM